MWKFIFKSIAVLSPFIILYFLVPHFYSVDQGDLWRIGYFHKEDGYRTQFRNELHNPVYYKNISSIDTCIKSKYLVLVIGDSFTEQEGCSFNNYITDNDSISVLYYDVRGNLMDNPVEILHALINGDFFDKVSIDYVVLESVERDFSARANLNPDSRISMKDIVQVEKKKPDTFKKNIPFDNSIIKYLGVNALRSFKDGCISGVYRFESTRPVFSSKRGNEILIYEMDVYNLPSNSDSSAILKLNDELNHLSAWVEGKKSTLIVLPALDKYSVYYDYIKNKDKYPKPVFCNIMRALEKQYIYIDSDEILKTAVSSGTTDVYFADDTHWSPVGAKLIANAIKSKMKQSQISDL